MLVGLAGGVAAGVVWCIPVAARFGSGAGLAQGAALLIVAWSVHRAFNAATALVPGLGFGAAVGCGAAATGAASTAVAIILYALYAWLRPGVLAERYEAYVAIVTHSGRPATLVAAELARLAQHRARYLDPALAAGSAAATIGFVGLVAAAYLAWRRRLSRRGRPPTVGAHR